MPDVNRRAIAAGAVGNALEWYDFAVFGFFAPVISTQFFPADDHLAGLINTFGVFAAGYLMRPIGGFLFGHLGDRLGRRRALLISIIAMAVPTSLMAVLPTHEQVGALAALLLVVLRLAQGVSVGGEFIGSITYLVEMAPPGRRAYFGSWSVFSTVLGMLAGSAVAALLHLTLTSEQMADFGWRLPFLGGVVIGVIGVWLRLHLRETPSFQELQTSARVAVRPLGDAIRQMPFRMVQMAAMVMLLGVGIYVLFIWMPTYLTHIVSPPVPGALTINTLAMVVLVALMPVAGMVADRVGYKPVLAASMLVAAIVVYPLFLWIDTGALIAVIIAQLVFAIFSGFLQGATPVAMVEQFPARLRYSAMATGYNLTIAIFGGTAPLVATWLVQETGDLAAPAWYLATVAVISLVATLTLKRRTDLEWDT